MSTTCTACPRRCRLEDGAVGFCRARTATAGGVAPLNYGRLTALALDPIEKKPLRHFRPGSRVLSAGSFGCNLRCPFCQNHGIAQAGGELPTTPTTPEALVAQAAALADEGCIGLAYTYNEPLVGWEFVRDTAHLARQAGLANVVVTNGCFSPEVIAALTPYIDAWNIDLKCFSAEAYASLGGDFATVRQAIEAVHHSGAHLEVSTLVVPGLSDDAAGLREAARWLAGLSPGIPLHLSRYFPRWLATAPATPPNTLAALKAVAGAHLRHVYLGNI